jgi:signal transduction histidine kinase/CheY-like chemotaxis protein
MEILPKMECDKHDERATLMRGSMMRLIKNLLLLDSYNRVGDVEQFRKMVMVNSISLFAIVVLIIIGTMSFYRGDMMVALLDISAAAILIFCIAYHRRAWKIQLPVYVGMGIMTALFGYLFFSGGVNNTGFVWYYTYPTFALYLLGIRRGTIATMVLFIPAFIYMTILWPQDTPQYSQEFAIRFIPSVFCVFLFSYLFETTRIKTQKKLKAKQCELEDSILALREKEVELHKAHKNLEKRVESRTSELQVTNESLKIEIEERKRSEAHQRALEAQLIRAKKMEAIGILVSGVAHDLNNILSGIVSYPELLLQQLPADSPLRNPLETVHQSGMKAAAIVRDLLTMGRRGVNVEEVIQLNDVVDGFLQGPEFKALIKTNPHVVVNHSLASDLSFIRGSATHIDKTVMNLITNAFEAMSQDGKISIVTENCMLDIPVKGYEEIPPGNYVKLVITDTGSGISPLDIQHIFEPFYTKKAMGRSGTGLGMSVVWATIKDHEGFIDIKSTMGEGTSIMVFLNATDAVPDRPKSAILLENYSGASELILVVDDQEEQRMIARATLSELGYTVETAPSGEAAIDYLKKNKPDLVILDMIMDPGMDGLDTYSHISKIYPDLRVIIASGYSESDRMEQARRLGVFDYISKPYSLAEFARKVRGALYPEQPGE